jgi:hypothetical protein
MHPSCEAAAPSADERKLRREHDTATPPSVRESRRIVPTIAPRGNGLFAVYLARSGG